MNNITFTFLLYKKDMLCNTRYLYWNINGSIVTLLITVHQQTVSLNELSLLRHILSFVRRVKGRKLFYVWMLSYVFHLRLFWLLISYLRNSKTLICIYIIACISEYLSLFLRESFEFLLITRNRKRSTLMKKLVKDTLLKWN